MQSPSEKYTFNHVSIPHWFSLNLKRFLKISESSSGFHPTLVLAQLFAMGLLNQVVNLFPSHIGSRSTLSLLPRERCVGVSIPHWFSLNGARIKTLPLLQLKFPSHIGSRSTNLLRSSSMPLRSFHPTLVLAQRFSCPSIRG